MRSWHSARWERRRRRLFSSFLDVSCHSHCAWGWWIARLTEGSACCTLASPEMSIEKKKKVRPRRLKKKRDFLRPFFSFCFNSSSSSSLFGFFYCVWGNMIIYGGAGLYCYDFYRSQHGQHKQTSEEEEEEEERCNIIDQRGGPKIYRIALLIWLFTLLFIIYDSLLFVYLSLRGDCYIQGGYLVYMIYVELWL